MVDIVEVEFTSLLTVGNLITVLVAAGLISGAYIQLKKFIRTIKKESVDDITKDNMVTEDNIRQQVDNELKVVHSCNKRVEDKVDDLKDQAARDIHDIKKDVNDLRKDFTNYIITVSTKVAELTVSKQTNPTMPTQTGHITLEKQDDDNSIT
jgi:hypothetical protein